MRRHYLWWIGLLWSALLLAQPKAELNLLLGGSTYLGDLQEQDRWPSLDQAGIAPGLRFGLAIRNTWQLRAGLQYAKYEAADALNDDPELRARDFSFTGNAWETSLQLVWEPFANRRYPAEGGYKNIISPYVFAGAGLAVYDATTRYGTPGVDGFPDRIQADIDAEDAPAWVLPVGAGLRFDLNKNLSLGLEYGLRRTTSDQLDGVSTSGKADTKDWYSVGGLTLAYRWVTPDYDRDGFLDEFDRCPEQAGVPYTNGCPDSDGDGIEDALDRCPYQPGKAAVGGCPDTDFDGVADLIDKCPDYPGDLSAQGCPDADGDGLRDDYDMCPHCPAPNGLSGCPDTDGDGIEDARDRCPQLAGTPEGNGCPYLDADQDGIPDAEDACPDLRGTAAGSGCPDSDDDGISDPQDKCPDLAGTLANGGCPEVTEEIKATLAFVTEAVQFATGSNQLKDSSREKLNELVDLLTTHPYYHLTISGHTDSQGKSSNNLRLSQKRAEACYDYLVAQGIAPTRMAHEGYGESQPIATNDTAAGRKKNRRVAFEVFVP